MLDQMFCQTVDQTCGQLLAFKKKDTKFIEQQHSSINRKVRQKKLITRIERNKQKRFELINNRRFSHNDEWSYCSYYCIEDISEHETDFCPLSQPDIIQTFIVSYPLPKYESILKNAVTNAFNLIESIDYDFDAIIELDNDFFEVKLLNKISSFIGSDAISHSLQVQILKMIKELVRIKQLNDLLVRNIATSCLAHKLVYLVECGHEELVEQSVGVIEELMNQSNVLIFHILNCGYINALKNRGSQLKWKTSKTLIQQLRDEQKLNSLAFSRIARLNSDNKNMKSNQKLSRVLSRAVLQLFCTESNQLTNFAQCLVPLLQKFLTSPDDVVKQNALSTLSMFDQNDITINRIMTTNFSPHLFYLITTSNDSIVILVLQLLNRIIGSDRKVVKQKSFLIQIIHNLNNLLIKSTNNQIIKEAIACVITIAESLPIDSLFFSENFEKTALIIDSLLKLTNKLRVSALCALQKVLQTFSVVELQYLFRSCSLMVAIKQMLQTCDQNCQIIGLQIISHIFETFSKAVRPSLMTSFKKLFYEKGFNVLLTKLSWHNNRQVCKSSEHILKSYIDPNLDQTEDKSISPVPNGNQYEFGIKCNIPYFVF